MLLNCSWWRVPRFSVVLERELTDTAFSKIYALEEKHINGGSDDKPRQKHANQKKQLKYVNNNNIPAAEANYSSGLSAIRLLTAFQRPKLLDTTEAPSLL